MHGQLDSYMLWLRKGLNLNKLGNIGSFNAKGCRPLVWATSWPDSRLGHQLAKITSGPPAGQTSVKWSSNGLDSQSSLDSQMVIKRLLAHRSAACWFEPSACLSTFSI
ncbi:unnamed protein product [Clavelina lepadiformis]|uniref:Uncharacterized protein n=1 Tax=Clavelina lepadiformis TaxID=159417 RepID=A0ABP0GIC6_CLALP